MKKITLFAMGAFVAMAAQAQYSVNPATSVVAAKNPVDFSYIVLSDAGIAELTAAGAKGTYIGPDPDNGRNLWYWDNTFTAGDESYPRVDQAEGGYVSLVVGTVGWSGAGFDVQGDGIDLSKFNDDTRFHLAYMTPSGNGPASVALIIFDGSTAYTENEKEVKFSSPTKVALGTAFEDNGATYPAIGPALGDDWQGVDISLGELNKLFPFALNENTELNKWRGNVLSILGGGVTGQTLAFDAVYFYNTTSSDGIADAVEDNTDFVVTGNTVNVMNGQGIALYNIAGQLVKSTEGTTLGINNMQGGIYIARSGNKVQKVVVR